MRRADKPTFPAGKGSPDGRIKRRGGRCRLSVLLLFCVLLAGATCPACAGKPVKHTASFFAMDTVITVTLYTPDAELAGQQLERCRELLAELDGLWSRYVAGSDVWRLNQSADGLCDLDPRTVALLEQALEISLATGGAFDPMGALPPGLVAELNALKDGDPNTEITLTIYRGRCKMEVYL